MADYGIKISKQGEDVMSASNISLLLSTKFPNTKIDQTKNNTFRTTTVTFLNNPPEAILTEIASFEHGYTYKPEVWGLWHIVWGPGSLVSGQIYDGYGTVASSTGVPSATITYKITDTHIKLYAYWSDPFDLNPIDLTGTVATLTSYVFADDLSTQDYTV